MNATFLRRRAWRGTNLAPLSASTAAESRAGEDLLRLHEPNTHADEVKRLTIALFLLACSGAEPDARGPESASHETATQAQTPEPQTPVQQEAHLRDGMFSAEGAPPPRACESASDCLGDTVPDPSNPCCNGPYSLDAYSRDYRSWVATWRSAHCDDVQCPPPPPPSPPPDCAFELQCVEGVCANGC